MSLGPGSIALIVAAGLVLFGPKKLPDLGRSLGETLREFKKATSGILDEEPTEEKISTDVQKTAPTLRFKKVAPPKTRHYIIKRQDVEKPADDQK